MINVTPQFANCGLQNAQKLQSEVLHLTHAKRTARTLQNGQDECGDKHASRSAKQKLQRKREILAQRAEKKLLGELHKDREYLEKLLNHPLMKTTSNFESTTEDFINLSAC